MVERDGQIAETHDDRRSSSAGSVFTRVLDRLNWAGSGQQWPITVGGVFVAFLLIVWSFNRNGLPLSPDAEAYVAMADAISQGDFALTSLVGDGALLYPPLHFPPLYPLLIAVLSLVPGIDPVLAGVVISSLSVLVTMLGVNALLTAVHRDQVPGYWRLFLVLSVSLHKLMFELGRQVLSDSSFFALWIWILVFLLRFAKQRRTVDLAALCGLGAAACALRYPGAFLAVGVVGALTLVDLRRRALPITAAVFGAVALLPVGLWYAWASQRTSGGLGHGDGGGRLGVIESGYDSIAGLGALALGIQQSRPEGSSRRGGFVLPEPFPVLVPPIATAAGAVLVVLAVCVLVGRPVPKLRHRVEPGTLNALRLVSIPTAVYLGSVWLFRARGGVFVIQRYWGVAATIFWIVLAVHAYRERSSSPSLITVLLFASTLTSLLFLIRGLVV